MILDEHVCYKVVEKINEKKYPLYFAACDSSGKKVDQTSGFSVHSELQKGLGIKVYTHKTEKYDSLRATQMMLYRGQLTIDPKCTNLIRMFQTYEWKNERSICPRRAKPYP